MRHFRENRYQLIIALVILSTMLLVGVQERREAQIPKQAAAEGSPYHSPFAWHGVACLSELSLQNPSVPFNISIMHPPGKERTVVDQGIQELPEQNSTMDDTPYPDEDMERYIILRTACRDSWQEVFEKWGFMHKPGAYGLLPQGKVATEADFRKAILQYRFPKNFEIAERIFPLEAEIVSTMPDK